MHNSNPQMYPNAPNRVFEEFKLYIYLKHLNRICRFEL